MWLDFPAGPEVGSPPVNAGDMGLTPRLGGLHMPQGNWARVPHHWTHTHTEACMPQSMCSASKRSHLHEEPEHN